MYTPLVFCRAKHTKDIEGYTFMKKIQMQWNFRFFFPVDSLHFREMEKIKNQCSIGQRPISSLKALDHIFKKSDTLSSFID